MIIGIPRALLYYKYSTLWRDFFATLGHETLISPKSDAAILQAGIEVSVDESCLPFKIFMGHIRHLLDKCDYILVPRMDNFGKNERLCVKFNALYDIVRSTLKCKLIDYDVDVLRGKQERSGFLRMGRLLGASRRESMRAYKGAKAAQREQLILESEIERSKLLGAGKKILLAGHPYNCHDELIGRQITKLIEKNGATVIYADRLHCAGEGDFSRGLYWTFNKELCAAAYTFQGCVDGIVFLTAFPCGPDSLVTELMLRRLKGIPVINLVVDELQSQTGLETRIESFLDIISFRLTG